MKEKVILYDSRRTSKAESNYDSTRIELACFLWTCESHKYLLYPYTFKWFCDNAAMKSIHTMQPPKEVTKRWLNIINTYNFEVEHIKGKNNTLVDYLSRKGCSLQKRPSNEYNDEAPLTISAIEYNMSPITDPAEEISDESSSHEMPPL